MSKWRKKFSQAKRSVAISSTFGMAGYFASFFIPIVPQVVVVVASVLGGALVARRTGRNNSQ